MAGSLIGSLKTVTSSTAAVVGAVHLPDKKIKYQVRNLPHGAKRVLIDGWCSCRARQAVCCCSEYARTSTRLYASSRRRRQLYVATRTADLPGTAIIRTAARSFKQLVRTHHMHVGLLHCRAQFSTNQTNTHTHRRESESECERGSRKQCAHHVLSLRTQLFHPCPGHPLLLVRPCIAFSFT